MEPSGKNLPTDIHPRALRRRLALGIGFLALIGALLASASLGAV